MVVQIRDQVVLVKLIKLFGMLLWYVSVPQQLPDDRAVLTFYQGVIVAMPGAGLAQLDVQLVQQLRHVVVNKL